MSSKQSDSEHMSTECVGEPVAKYIGEDWSGSLVSLYDDIPLNTLLYTTPQQRKPLTDEQIKDVASSCMWWVREQDILDDAIELARAIEAAHGIKSGTDVKE
jgi:hypothetical protein